jgi:hypothetical protein
VAVLVGATESTTKPSVCAVSAFPALSVERNSSVWAPWPVTWNGAAYVVKAPPSSRYCVESTPEAKPSVALSVTVGFTYQPLTAGGVSAAALAGGVPSTENAAVCAGSAFPALSTERYSSTRGPSPVIWNGPE